MDRSALRGKIQTVLGLRDPGELGFTLMHEHLLVDLVKPSRSCCPQPEPPISLETRWRIDYGRMRHDDKFRLNDIDCAVAELAYFKKAGGHTLVELTTGGLKPNPIGLSEIARQSGIDVVMGCGYYVDEYQTSETRLKTVESFATEISSQILQGAWGTDVRAGIIGEIGCQWPWTDSERRVMSGAIIAQQETGASISVHPARNPEHPSQIVDFVQRAGGDVTRVIISHIDRTIFDERGLFRLADSGCVIEYDFFGWETTYYPLADVDLPNDGARLRWIRTLINRGHLSQILISHDICQKTRLVRYGGHGYSHICENVLPLMRARGFSEAEIRALTIDNPKRLLTIT